MPKFIVNKGSTSQKTVEAESYSENGSYTTFWDSYGKQVLSVKTSMVASIRRESDAA